MFWNKKVKHLKESNEAYRQEIAKLRTKLTAKEETIKLISDSCNRLSEENEKLIKWIHEILNTVGMRNVDGTFPISIPIYRDINRFGFTDGHQFREERIVIPEITLISTRSI